MLRQGVFEQWFGWTKLRCWLLISRDQRVGLQCDNSSQAVSCDIHTDSDSDTSADDADASTNVVVATVSTPVTDSNDCEVCLIAQRDERIALVPCGHRRFCETCANEVERQGRGCPSHSDDPAFVLTSYKTWITFSFTVLLCALSMCSMCYLLWSIINFFKTKGHCVCYFHASLRLMQFARYLEVHWIFSRIALIGRSVYYVVIYCVYCALSMCCVLWSIIIFLCLKDTLCLYLSVRLRLI